MEHKESSGTKCLCLWALRLSCVMLFALHPSLFSPVCADEVTILLGPKTIGPAWKDNILLEARHFAGAKAGDVVTVYNDGAKRTAQAAFQDPADWQGVAPEYGCFNVGGPFRMTLDDDIISKLRERGCYIGGHDYRILRVTLTPAEEFQEKIVWRGPSKQMKPDWSESAELPASCFKSLKVGDGLRLHASRVEAGAAAKLMDFTWNVLEPSTDGIPVGADGCTYYVNDDAPLLKLQLAGTGDNIAMRIGGKGYRLDRVGIVQFTGKRSEDLSLAQRAPKEYRLEPGELFHGEKLFPSDWSGNLRLTAEPFQECTVNDVVILHYELIAAPATKAQISFRENRGKWRDLSGTDEPVWLPLDGTDVVLAFDEQSLDKVKTSGLVVTGVGFMLTRIEIITAQ